jgi:putative transposase
VQAWIAEVGAKTAYIAPGSPWENGYIESLNARLHDELLDGEIFYSLREAQRSYREPAVALQYGSTPIPLWATARRPRWYSCPPSPFTQAAPNRLSVAPRPSLN